MMEKEVKESNQKAIQHFIENKAALCQKISALHEEVNELALHLSSSSRQEINLIWTNLANARAYLANALVTANEIKDGKSGKYSGDWQI